MTVHKWVAAAPTAKYNEDGSVAKYTVRWACALCGTEIRTTRPQSILSFELPLPEEMRDSHVDADCDMTQVRQVMES